MSAITQADVLTFARPDRVPKPPRTPVEPGLANGWRPAVNAYSCQDKFVVFMELAGLEPTSVEVKAGARSVTIAGSRRPPEPGCARSALNRLLALEIDHGSFERTVQFPQDIDPAGITTAYVDGLLRIEAPLAAGGA